MFNKVNEKIQNKSNSESITNILSDFSSLDIFDILELL